MKKILLTLLTAAAVTSFTTTGFANDEKQALLMKAPTTAEGLNTKSLSMVTGSRTGTYFRFGQDMAAAVKGSGVSVDVKESTGSIDNIGRIGSKEDASIGIVQSDVLTFLKRSKDAEFQKMANNLRMILPLYQEEVHVIARKSINSLDDLVGKTVAVGKTGSGSWLTAMNMFTLSGIKPEKVLRLSPEEGLVHVLRNKADAMIFVAGKPVKLFENLNKLAEHNEYANLLERIHILPIQHPKLNQEYSEAMITNADYNFVEQSVPTIAVSSLLVSYNFSAHDNNYADSRCNQIRTFSNALYNSLGDLKQNAHSKWNEVSLDTQVMLWERDPCAVQQAAGAKLENELLNILQQQNR